MCTMDVRSQETHRLFLYCSDCIGSPMLDPLSQFPLSDWASVLEVPTFVPISPPIYFHPQSQYTPLINFIIVHDPASACQFFLYIPLRKAISMYIPFSTPLTPLPFSQTRVSNRTHVAKVKSHKSFDFHPLYRVRATHQTNDTIEIRLCCRKDENGRPHKKNRECRNLIR